MSILRILSPGMAFRRLGLKYRKSLVTDRTTPLKIISKNGKKDVMEVSPVSRGIRLLWGQTKGEEKVTLLVTIQLIESWFFGSHLVGEGG